MKFTFSYTNDTVINGTFTTMADNVDQAYKSFEEIVGPDAQVLSVGQE